MAEEQGGFALYVQNLRRKMGGRRAFGASAYEAALPGWQRLRQEDKQIWTNRALDLQRTQAQYSPRCPGPTPWEEPMGPFMHPPPTTRPQPFLFHHSTRSHSKSNKSSASMVIHAPSTRQTTVATAVKSTENLEVDDEDEWGVGAPEVDGKDTPLDAAAIEKLLEEKYESDKKRITELVLKKTDGCKEKIKKIRWLFASAQTFGHVDGVCMPAEIALSEFDLTEGILDTFSSLVGPWELRNEVQRSRATFHANETHGIPLDIRIRGDKSAILMEVLGRTEPQLAARQGVRLGLYSGEVDDFVRSYYHVEHRPQRRFLLCLRQEYRDIQAAFSCLKQSVGLQYDGFPTTPDDFVLADAFVDALAAMLLGQPVKEYHGWLRALGSTLPKEFATPWERDVDLFCQRHRSERNSCCAAVTVGRATYIIMYAVEHLLQ